MQINYFPCPVRLDPDDPFLPKKDKTPSLFFYDALSLNFFIRNQLTLNDTSKTVYEKVAQFLEEYLPFKERIGKECVSIYSSFSQLSAMLKANNQQWKAFFTGNIFTKKNISFLRNKTVRHQQAITSMSPYLNDIDRVVFSSAFRRLQDKAQVFSLEDFDYVRTRLTHSMEVSEIAEQLCYKLLIFSVVVCQQPSFFSQIVRCDALLHDLGNPPFGHYGEAIIRHFFANVFMKKTNEYSVGEEVIKQIGYKKTSAYPDAIIKSRQMKDDFLWFDGNAQGLRIATHLQIFNEKPSLNLTASVLSGMIKYPFPSNKTPKKGKFSYFYSENDVISFLKRNQKYQNNQIDICGLIMEASDDIAYLTSDIDDAVKKGAITYEDIVTFDYSREKKMVRKFKNDFIRFYKENSTLGFPNPLEVTIQRMTQTMKTEIISEFAYKLYNLKSINKYTNRNRKGIVEILSTCRTYKVLSFFKETFITSKVFMNKMIFENEIEGETILTFLLDELTRAVLNTPLEIDKKKCTFICASSNLDPHRQKNIKLISLFSSHIKRAYCLSVSSLKHSSPQILLYYRLKMVTDYVSGMTDSYAKKLYLHLTGK
jgi:dGTPase